MKYSLFIVLLSVLFSCKQAQTSNEKQTHIQKPDVPYSEYISGVMEKRLSYEKQYVNANPQEKKELIVSARKYLLHTLTKDIFAYWYGTQWDFNGTTRTPGEGSIACGYFVTNVLSDVGFKIPRVKWAQSASEVFIVQLANEELKRSSNASMKKVRSYLKKAGEGLYLVGLDSHVGFVYVQGDQMKFIHSNYYSPTNGVSMEELETHNPLNDSSYRVFGKLLSDQMVERWILGVDY